MTATRRVVVVDDEVYSRIALERLISEADPSVTVGPGMDFEVAGGFGDWAQYDQVFLDLAQPLVGRDPTQTYGEDNEHVGCEIVRHIRRSTVRDRPAVIVLTSQQASFDSDYVRAWLIKAGADGFVLRHALPGQLGNILKQGRSFRRDFKVTDAFRASEDGVLLAADIDGFVQWGRKNNVRRLPSGRAGEDRRQKIWERGAATGAPLGAKRKRVRAERLLDNLTRILPARKHDQ